MQAIETRALAKTVGRDRRLFHDLAMSVSPGELVAITGDSGVGKSTLLNILAGLDDADAGEVLIEGTSLAPLAEAARTRLRRERIGFVFQAFHILPYLTLEQNVALPLALISSDGAAARSRASEMLAEVGLADRGRDYARDLSGGELQRVAIARALVASVVESVVRSSATSPLLRGASVIETVMPPCASATLRNRDWSADPSERSGLRRAIVLARSIAKARL